MKFIKHLIFLINLSFGIWPSYADICKNSPSSPSQKADKILIKKKDRLLLLLNTGKIIKQYKVSLGFDPNGPKTKTGDGKTPEGFYRISGKNSKSRFHRSLRISYPNENDRKKGCTGGDIMIHGLGPEFSWLGKAHTLKNWTLGCVAVTNAEIEEIWALVLTNTPIEIQP